MSMILDAIKRSREAPERGGSVPSLDTKHHVLPDESTWKKVGLTSVALTAVSVLVAVLALVFLTNHYGSAPADIEGNISTNEPADIKGGGSQAASLKDISPDTESQLVRASATPVSASSIREKSAKVLNEDMRDIRPIVIPTETQPTKTGALNAEALSSLYAAMNEEAEAALDSSTISEAETEVVADTLDQTSEVSEASKGGDDITAIDFAEILAQAQKELGVQALVESDEPLLETLSQQTKDQIPSLIYSEHKYSANGRSEVVLNGQSLSERQRVGPFTVVKILPDSVILRWRETQFRVRARNSWINM